MKMENSEKEKYSFSKLNAFLTCRYGYKLTYIDHQKGVGNCFSSFGCEVHSLMERLAKGNITLWDLVSTYEWEFDAAIPESFPDSKFCPNMRQLYYNQGLEFLKNFPGFNGKKILEVESQFDIPIDDWTFTGIIDLVFEDESGHLILQDYKSKSAFKNKNEQAKYARQLYLYSLYIKEKYGRYPDTLRFLMFRKNRTVDIPFDINGLNEAVSWAKNTVKEIRDCWDYYPSCDDFFSQHLCNHRETCDCKNK